MRNRFSGIFGKVFFYTLLIIAIIILVMFMFFSDQIKSAVDSTQQLQITNIFQPLLDRVNGKSDDEVIEIAKRFHEKNTSFEFCIESSDGDILYKTKNFKMQQHTPGILPEDRLIIRGDTPAKNLYNYYLAKGIGEKIQLVTLISSGRKLYVAGTISGSVIYQEFLQKAVFAFSLIFLISILAAYLFARQIAKPIKKIAKDVREMSELKPVSAPATGKDEIGQLAGDVYSMYKTLKATIGQLETEIEREKVMEENQRYFFSAASHELKTPIAATSALLEGILENVIEPEQYPEYLRKCLKMMNEQNKLVTEILDIASLNNNSITINREKQNLKEFINGILVTFHTIADGKGQRINTDISEKLSCTFDNKLFGKALSNIIMNAIQNTPEGGRITVFTQEMKSNVRLCILNEGVKIPKEILPKLFEPFYREDKARSREQGRIGLGLTIVKKTLDLLEIPFSLENADNGVLFRMDLPYL